MELGNDFMDEFREFMRVRQEYLKQKHHSVAATQIPDKTIEPQQQAPVDPPVPAKQQGFQVLPLPPDLQMNLVKCVHDEGMKVMTPETVFIQQILREMVELKAKFVQLSDTVVSLLAVNNSINHQSSRSNLLPVAHQDEHAFRPIEVKQETPDPVPDRRGAIKRKRHARNRRSTEDGEG